MNRRVFMRIAGVAAAAGAVQALAFARSDSPDARPGTRAGTAPGSVEPKRLRLTVPEAGTYRIAGLVRLDQPVVEIGGFTHTQRISWAGGAGEQVSTFTAFEYFASADAARTIQVTGGRLESVSAVRLDFA